MEYAGFGEDHAAKEWPAVYERAAMVVGVLVVAVVGAAMRPLTAGLAVWETALTGAVVVYIAGLLVYLAADHIADQFETREVRA